MVYVISQNGKPLMPTEHHGKVRWLLKRKRAKVVRRTPFTIQLLYGTGSERTQPAGHPEVASSGEWYAMQKLRCHNRKIHKDTILKGGIRKHNQTERIIGGFGLWDIVFYDEILCYIHGRRSSGYFDIRKLDGTKVHSAVHYRKLTLVKRTNTRLIERRKPVPLPPAEAGVSPANI